jgi:hypothetical protein
MHAQFSQGRRNATPFLRRYSIFSEYLELLLTEEQEDEIIYV